MDTPQCPMMKPLELPFRLRPVRAWATPQYMTVRREEVSAAVLDRAQAAYLVVCEWHMSGRTMAQFISALHCLRREPPQLEHHHHRRAAAHNISIV